MCQQTVKVHLPNSLSLACPDCSQVARTFTYRRTKVRKAPTLDDHGCNIDPDAGRKVASVRTWQWICECGQLVKVENRIDLGPNGERGEVLETVTLSDPTAVTAMFDQANGDAGIELVLREDLSFLDRDGSH